MGRTRHKYPASKKAAIMQLAEQSHLPAKRTLDKLGIPRAILGASQLQPKAIRPSVSFVMCSQKYAVVNRHRKS
jgi:hypothetical protein